MFSCTVSSTQDMKRLKSELSETKFDKCNCIAILTVYSNCYSAYYSDEQWLEEHSLVTLKKIKIQIVS